MNEIHVVEHLLAYVNGNLDEAARRAVEEHISACDSCRRECDALKAFWENLGNIPEERPPSRLVSGFHALLDAYAEGGRQRDHASMPGKGLRGRNPAFRPAVRIAFAGSLVAAGLACGYLLGGGSTSEVAELRGEVRALSNLLTVSLLHQESASERLKGVSLGSRMEGMDPDISAALISTMKHDRSVNVRLAALDALTRDIDNPGVRGEIIHGLAVQTSPLMQIALVDVIVQMNDRESRDALKEAANMPGLLPDVRTRIQQGIQHIL